MSVSLRTGSVFRPARIDWVRDGETILLVNVQKNKVDNLSGVDASVWIWLTLHYSYSRLTNLLVALLNVSRAEAEEQLKSIFLKWVRMGILIQEKNVHG
jgi:hypothetical protein